MARVLIGGSFDPPTVGHNDVIFRASKHFDVIVCFANNEDKTRRFSKESMVNAMYETLKEADIQNVYVTPWEGELVDAAKLYDVDFLVRGIRNATDYIYEEEMAAENQRRTGIDTIFIRSDRNLTSVSSSKLMNMLENGEDISPFVSKPVYAAIMREYADNSSNVIPSV